MRIGLNQSSFESLRSFVVHEIQVMISDYAQAFFKSGEREVQRERSSTGGVITGCSLSGLRTAR